MRSVEDTPRLRFRELVEDDVDTLATLFADPEVMQYIGTGGVLTRDRALRSIERQQAEYRERGFGEWATIERETDAMIGLCGLIRWPDIDGVEELEVAYLLARDAWGRGLGTEAATAIRDHAIEHLGRTRLISCIYPDNHASIRVATKVGMHFEKTFTYEGSPMSLFSLEAAPSA
ncbi:MAG TPA: GNAT family N-acetyltransferase [Actinomycetota bacterium]